MSINKLAEMIRSSGGKFFSVTFIKRTTGELRRMSARLGVQKNLTGRGLAFEPRDHDLMTVWDANKGNYRMVNLRGLRSFKCGKKEWRAA